MNFTKKQSIFVPFLPVLSFKTNCRGASMIIYCISLTVLLAATSLVADIGMVVIQKNRVMNAVDASVLAGAQELIYNSDNAEIKALEYLQKNGVNPSQVLVELNETETGVRVLAQTDVDFYFARILGFSNTTVGATASAAVFPVSSVSGARPFAIEDQELLFGETYILKNGGGDGSGGNYGGIELGGSGANIYCNNIIEGYSGRLFVGDFIDTEPGNMSGPTEYGIGELLTECYTNCPGCTYESFQPDCPRLITVVMVDSLSVDGRSTVQIVGFASFFLEGVAGSGNESEVTGKFVRTITTGEISESQNDYGLYGVKLME